MKADINKFWGYLRGRPLVWDTITTTIWSTLGKALGFLVPFFIAAWFGVSGQTDAFFFAYGLIIFLATIFSPVVESIIVPFIAEFRAKGEDISNFVGRILGLSAAGLGAISIFFLMIMKPILPLLTRFSPEGQDLVYRILLESIPLFILLVWTSVLAGTLNAYKIFGIPALSPAFRAIVTLVFIFAFKGTMGVHAIALGYVVGEIFRLVVLSFLLRKLNILHFRLLIGWEAKFAEFLKTSSYQIIGMSMLAFTPIINKTMASWLGPGNVSILEYADRLYIIPITFLSTGLLITILSHWSERYYIDGAGQLKNDVWKAVKVVGTAALLLTAILLLTKDSVVNIVYGYGKFPQRLIDEVGVIFGFYLLGLTPYLLSQVYVRAFLTRKDTRVLLLTAFFMITGTIAFNLVFIRIIGVAGIALANSVVALLSLGILCFLFYKRLA